MPVAAREAPALPVPAWDTVRIESGQRTVVVPRAQAGALASAMADLLAARGAAVSGRPGPAALHVTVLDATRTAGQLALGDGTVTWQAAGEPAQTWQPEPGLLAALRAQALQLLQR